MLINEILGKHSTQINEMYVGNMTPYQEARSRFDGLAKLHAYTLREYGRQPRVYEANGYHQVLQRGNPPENLSPYEKDMLIPSVESAIINLKAMKADLSKISGLDLEVQQVDNWIAFAEQYIRNI